MSRFNDRVCVITGAGSGIGKETAIRLAKEGAKVVLVGRTESKLNKVATEIVTAYGEGSALSFPADVTKEEDVLKLAQFVKGQYGRLEVVINNAGGSGSSSILEMNVDEWDRTQATNLKSVFLVSKQLSKVMIETKAQQGAIVNVASLSGYKAGAKIPHYSAAKAGVINFTRALANELAPFVIRVNSVSPGFIETPLTEKGLENEHFTAAIERNTALKRVGKAKEIANVITFVASSEASYMTGSDVLVDGGWLIT
ncbi:SDR family NAD(P)-dependent oxidoreductase [Alkalihalobacillus sp. BA299]|uniref:SDR family NAD(P)-dependent oxidoreductase n=1 Tax=Alkalihalobacillus sp. BA299 TaxID=2815938 RepID=UPI001ADD1B52|nr:glucose 1-dehydrogenase [Alkalihalobacillus sp. BA299]